MIGRRGMLIALLAAAAGGLMGAWGCRREPSGTVDRMPADELARRLNHAMALERMRAAEELAKLPPNQLQKVVPALKAAIAKEKDKQAKAAMQKALDAAGGGG